MKKNIIYIGEWNRNTYNGHGKMWWYPDYEAMEKQDDTFAETYTGEWINGIFQQKVQNKTTVRNKAK